MTRRSTTCAVIALLALLALPASAWAQASPEAEVLFRDGKRLIKEGKLAEACRAFEASERAEHNIATLMNLADCRERSADYATAWALFLRVESETRGDAGKAMLNTTAKNRSHALEAKLSYLTIEVPEASRVAALAITRDGAAVDPAEWNRAIPVDGGKHVVTATVPGRDAWSATLIIAAEADRKSATVPLLAMHPASPPPPHRVVRSERPPTLTPRRMIGLGALGAGVALAGGAVYFGVTARHLHDDALATCPPDACTTTQAGDAAATNAHARRDALYANLGFGLAGAAAITGAVLWFTGAPEQPHPIAIAPTSNGFAIAGSF